MTLKSWGESKGARARLQHPAHHKAKAISLPNSPSQRPLTCFLSSCPSAAGVAEVEAGVAVEAAGGVEAESSIFFSPRADSHAEPHDLLPGRLREPRPVAGS